MYYIIMYFSQNILIIGSSQYQVSGVDHVALQPIDSLLKERLLTLQGPLCTIARIAA